MNGIADIFLTNDSTEIFHPRSFSSPTPTKAKHKSSFHQNLIAVNAERKDGVGSRFWLKIQIENVEEEGNKEWNFIDFLTIFMLYVYTNKMDFLSFIFLSSYQPK